MSDIFINVLNLSITGSYVIIVVLFLRLLLKRFPKIISYILWALVGIRLIFPISFESVLSFIPKNVNVQPISNNIVYQEIPKINSGIVELDNFVSKSLPQATVEASVNPLQIYVEIGTYIWIIGIVIMLGYSLYSVLSLKKKLKVAVAVENNIYEVDGLKTPFILGVLNPKIYLPSGLKSEEREYILLHEEIHIKRKDYIIKLLAFMILTIHFFNPLVWLAFKFMSRDMELSCDEAVIKKMSEDIKKPYAYSLLSFSTNGFIFNGGPLAFGEENSKERIKNVLNYKKPKFWVMVLGLFIIVFAGFGLLSNPSTNENDNIEKSYAEKPWDRRTPYLGDNNKVGSILFSLNLPEGIEREMIEFKTDEQLKGMWHLKGEIEWIKLPDFEYNGDDQIERLIYETVINKYQNFKSENTFLIVAPEIFGAYEEEDYLKVFTTNFFVAYRLQGKELSEATGGIIPSAITYRKDNDGNYVVESFEEAKDGSLNAPSIEEFSVMPVSKTKIDGVAEEIIMGDQTEKGKKMREQHYKNLYDHLKKNGIEDARLIYSDGFVKFSMEQYE